MLPRAVAVRLCRALGCLLLGRSGAQQQRGLLLGRHPSGQCLGQEPRQLSQQPRGGRDAGGGSRGAGGRATSSPLAATCTVA